MSLKTHRVGSLRAALAVVAACLLAGLAAACGGGDSPDGDALPGEGKPALTLGTKDFPEQFILGELYAQALEAQGFTVNLNKNIGATEIIDNALLDGEIDAYPEYLGVTLSVLAGDRDVPETAAATYERAKDFYENRGQAVSERTPFSNIDAIATTKGFAAANGLETIGDLAKVDRVRLGARPEFVDRYQGLRGILEVYDLTNVEFIPLAQGIAYRELDEGNVDAINVFTTDAQLATGSYAVLGDPENLFGFQHVALVIDREKLDELGGDEFMAIVDRVNAELTTEVITEMNEAVFIQKQPEAEVARDFLGQKGLLEPA